MPLHPSLRNPPRFCPQLGWQLALSALCGLSVGPACAEGLNALGSFGGLAIPSAHALGDGTVALAASNMRESQFGDRARPRSYVLGVGLAPGLDLVGRFAEYATRRDGFIGGNAVDGISDLSANLKYSLSMGRWQPGLHLALGLQDFAGTGARFRNAYGVATQSLGAFELTAGIGRDRGQQYVTGTKAALDGLFGGLAYTQPIGPSLGHVSLVAEHDGRQAVAGARWRSAPMQPLANASLVAALHRSAGQGPADRPTTAVTLGLSMPFGANERELAAGRPAVDAAVPDSPRGPAQATVEAQRSVPARMSAVKLQLEALGLERVRVGRLADGSWVLHYQNRRFGHNELDALGLALGLAAQAAPLQLRTLVVVALKLGQPTLTLRTDAQAWRDYLLSGDAGPARAATEVLRGGSIADDDVDWVSDQASPGSALQLQLSPELNYAVGTELAAFDYSLAARLLVTLPLWRGAQLLASVQRPVAHSRNADAGAALADLRQPEGLQALALHQTLWLGQYAVLGGAVGRFEHGAAGAEGEALWFVPGRDDVLNLRGRKTALKPEMPPGSDLVQAASYRWVANASTWLELGAQRYADASSGPTLVFTRWWGDVATHLFYRKGGPRQFAGIEFSFPLTPRAAPVNPWLHVAGSPSYTRGLRTQLANGADSHNYLEPRRVRDLQLAWSLEQQSLNAGRLGAEYIQAQLPRMRQAYFLYAPPQVPATN